MNWKNLLYEHCPKCGNNLTRGLARDYRICRCGFMIHEAKLVKLQKAISDSNPNTQYKKRSQIISVSARLLITKALCDN